MVFVEVFINIYYHSSRIAYGSAREVVGNVEYSGIDQLLHFYHHRSRLQGYLEFYIK